MGLPRRQLYVVEEAQRDISGLELTARMSPNSPAEICVLLLLIFGSVIGVAAGVPFRWIRIYVGVLVGIIEGIGHISVFGDNLVAYSDVMTTNITPESRPSGSQTNTFPQTDLNGRKV